MGGVWYPCSTLVRMSPAILGRTRGNASDNDRRGSGELGLPDNAELGGHDGESQDQLSQTSPSGAVSSAESANNYG